ncbi:DUF123 domain-containing protein [Acidilobus saccharovorans]|nr:DUF123 domain-containing protein [Acidilobus saccharovorans]
MCPEGALRGSDALRGIRRRPDGVVDALPSCKGVYAICFRLDSPVIVMGRGGKVLGSAGPGLVLYVGSAGGPGGLRSRISRHFWGADRCWWHVDCISRAAASVEFIFYRVGSSGVKAEDELAGRLMELESLRPVGMLGATDSKRPHMFICSDRAAVVSLLKSVGTLVDFGDDHVGGT